MLHSACDARVYLLNKMTENLLLALQTISQILKNVDDADDSNEENNLVQICKVAGLDTIANPSQIGWIEQHGKREEYCGNVSCLQTTITV